MPVRLATRLLDISQLHTRSSINDQNKISLCTTRILPHFSSDYEQSLDRFPRLYRPWFLPNSSCVCPASFFPCRVTYRLMISSVIPTVDTKYPLTTSETKPCYGHSLDVNHPDRSFRSASPVATGIQDDLYIRSFFSEIAHRHAFERPSERFQRHCPPVKQHAFFAIVLLGRYKLDLRGTGGVPGRGTSELGLESAELLEVLSAGVNEERASPDEPAVRTKFGLVVPNPCLNSTATSPFIIAGFANFFRVGSDSLSLRLQLHVDEFYF